MPSHTRPQQRSEGSRRKPLTCFVTGVGRGLGREMAKRLLADGNEVIGTVRAGSSPPRFGDGFSLVEMDLTNLREFAFTTPFDVLINNAGVSDTASPGSSPALGELTAHHLEDVIRTNAIGPLLLTQALLPCLMERSTRRVVFMSSDLGSIQSNSSGGRYAYRASKAALNMIVKTLAADLSSLDFTVVAIHPGWVRTDMGGVAAPLGVTESTESVLRTVSSLTASQSGAFLDRFGDELPW